MSFPVSVGYRTADATAQAGTDYDAVSGILTFAAGEVSKLIIVPVHGDTMPEPDESLEVILEKAINAVLLDGLGFLTIRNDDAETPAQATAPAVPLEDSTLASPLLESGAPAIRGGVVAAASQAAAPGVTSTGPLTVPQPDPPSRHPKFRVRKRSHPSHPTPLRARMVDPALPRQRRGSGIEGSSL